MKKLLSDQSGATAIEYAFIALLVSTAIILGVANLGTAVNNKFEYVDERVTEATSGI